MKGKPKLHILYEYQLNTYLTCGFCGQIIAKNQLNRPYLSSRHLRNRSPQIRYNSAIFQYFCMKLSESLKNRKKKPLLWKRIFDLGLQKNWQPNSEVCACKLRNLALIKNPLPTIRVFFFYSKAILKVSSKNQGSTEGHFLTEAEAEDF